MGRRCPAPSGTMPGLACVGKYLNISATSCMQNKSTKEKRAKGRFEKHPLCDSYTPATWHWRDKKENLFYYFPFKNSFPRTYTDMTCKCDKPCWRASRSRIIWPLSRSWTPSKPRAVGLRKTSLPCFVIWRKDWQKVRSEIACYYTRASSRRAVAYWSANERLNVHVHRPYSTLKNSLSRRFERLSVALPRFKLTKSLSLETTWKRAFRYTGVAYGHGLFPWTEYQTGCYKGNSKNSNLQSKVFTQAERKTPSARH